MSTHDVGGHHCAGQDVHGSADPGTHAGANGATHFESYLGADLIPELDTDCQTDVDAHGK